MSDWCLLEKERKSEQSPGVKRKWTKRKDKIMRNRLTLAAQASQADTGQPPAPPDMAASSSGLIDEFASSGRSGRRNAMGDILDENYTQVSTSSLPFDFNKLDFKETTETPTTAANSEPSKDVNQTDSKTST